ncbi:N-6 DNA methylase [bacterium]|nr:N-6 DNA methylase [bacterium]
MALSESQLRDLIHELAQRPGHEAVRGDVKNLLTLHLGARSSDVRFEEHLNEVRGRIDALIGRTVFEFKTDLRKERRDAEEQLERYLTDLEKSSGQQCIGIATDGAEFLAFKLARGRLTPIQSYKPARDDIDGLPAWLRAVVSLKAERRPDPFTIRKELGRESLVYSVARTRLAEAWDAVKGNPAVAVKRDLWSRQLEIVYGSAIGGDELFLQHTYLTIVAKAIATIVLGAPMPEPADMLSGRPFRDAGIDGVVESDFFDWISDAVGGDELVRQIAGAVDEFRFADLEHDVLKVLYESLIDPEQRHELGEYYTPDWLASRICNHLIDRPLDQRVLDPSCGSGTFLFHAVRRFLAAADEAGIGHGAALTACTDRIFGIDVHPVAVINARITYLLAMGEERLRRSGRPSLSIPVYLGDSLQWNAVSVVSAQEVRIDVPDSEPLIFPVRVARNPALFDSVVKRMIEYSAAGAEPAAFRQWLDASNDQDLRANEEALTVTYARLKSLSEQNRDHIWGYVARNLCRPVWLSSAGQKVDVLAGNPPWLSYRYMSPAIRDRFKQESEKLGIWAGGKVATHQDLSAYFFAHAMDLYLRPGGKIGFVMPLATLSRKQFKGFLTRDSMGERGPVATPARRFTEAWTLESVQPLFNVPSCVIFAEAGSADGWQMPLHAIAYEGELLERDPKFGVAERLLTTRKVQWPKIVEDSDEGYSKEFRNGATVYPRLLFVVARKPVGRFGFSEAKPAVESRRSNLEDRRWKVLPSLTGSVEKEFLRPLYLGESIAPFRVIKSFEAIIPWDGKKLLDASTARKSGLTGLSDWLTKAEEVWRENRSSEMTLIEQLNYQNKLVTQFPINRRRVVYTKSGTHQVAALIENLQAVVENRLYWLHVSSEETGNYIVAVLNSEVIRKLVAPQQSRGQWGPRDFDKLLAAAVPRFDSSNPLHAEIAQAGERAAEVAKSVDLPESMHFIRARKVIREALKKDGIADEIEKLVAKLFR